MIEFPAGRRVAHAGRDVSVKALTNDAYQDSTAYLRLRGGPVPGSASSRDRFSRLGHLLAGGAPESGSQAVAVALRALDSVKQGNTRLQVVFDVKSRVIRFRTPRHPSTRHFSFDAFDLSCGSSSRILDWDADGSWGFLDRYARGSRRTSSSRFPTSASLPRSLATPRRA